MLETKYNKRSLIFYIRDCREDIDSYYDWMHAIEKHLVLDENWMEEDIDEAGE